MSVEPSRSETYLQDWHSRHPNACRVFENGRDPEGRSSYERLALLVAGDATALDIGCGNGALLAHLTAPDRPSKHLGIDLTRSELDLARVRLPSANLCCGRAQVLPFARASVDVVLCHMVLMLLDEPEQVLGEVRRVLRAGGMFSAITNRIAAPDPIARQIVGALRPLMESGDERRRPPKLGDVRTLESGALFALVNSQFEHVTVDSFAVTQLVPRKDLPRFLVESIYGFDAVADDDASRALNELTLPDPVPWTVPMLQVQGWV